jgi:parvulin-like peptidyl-prolyl isomerase
MAQQASLFARVVRDPLIWFLIAGAAIFWVADQFSAEEIPYSIDVTEADLQRLNDQWAMQMRREATADELSGLVEQFVKEEIYYREARRLKLDVNDTIVRRRMVQKLTFLTEDIATATPANDADLLAYYTENQADYQLPERYTFEHRYFSVDRRDDARADAQAALADPAVRGDPFMLQRTYAGRSEREIADQFGREFGAAMTELSASPDWQGPVQSAYGWHLVKLTQVDPARVMSFAEVRDKVANDAQLAARTAANDAYFESLRARYDVHLPQ